MLKIIQHKKVYLIFSGLLMLVSIMALSIFGLNLGIDFTGGSLMRIQTNQDQINTQDIKQILNQKQQEPEFQDILGNYTVQPVTENQFLIKTTHLEEKDHQQILQILKKQLNNKQANTEQVNNPITEIKYDSIGPTIGKELKGNAQKAILVVLVAIVIYIALAFKKVSSQLNKYESLRYALVAIIALIHDILITLGIFSVLGHFYNVQIDSYFIAALLTILGYSVNDTIIVLDRIRENILKKGNQAFEAVVNKSVNQVIGRSINTSITTLIVLFAILLFGGETIYYFVLTLIIGIISGTYSSIFLASPLLVVFKKLKN
ncbi:MAG: protein translocase subunit SecF [Candidatus Moranbacteria bacterium]|nr:protein translocase subunit SecF [Candidatus Moranbacteria bacterium]